MNNFTDGYLSEKSRSTRRLACTLKLSDVTRAFKKLHVAAKRLRPRYMERASRLAATCQIKDLYISVIVNFSDKESQMKRICTY